VFHYLLDCVKVSHSPTDALFTNLNLHSTQTEEWRKLHNEELKDLLPTQYRAGDKIEKNEMGGAHGAYGRGERCVQGFGGKT
jgi:hypothetical protein